MAEYLTVVWVMGLFGAGIALRYTRRGVVLRGYVRLIWRRLRRGCTTKRHFAPPVDEEQNCSDAHDSDEELPPEVAAHPYKTHKD